jgi:hypothetical protein
MILNQHTAVPAYTLFYPLITQIADYYSKFYTQTQPLRFKLLRHHFVDKPFKPAIVNLLNVVVCQQPDK